uniref:Uncharacterized protein n=1 Tax=Acrobeloides nanus TaxID=290746 RepID=A0A914C9P2_9BILA
MPQTDLQAHLDPIGNLVVMANQPGNDSAPGNPAPPQQQLNQCFDCQPGPPDNNSQRESTRNAGAPGQPGSGSGQGPSAELFWLWLLGFGYIYGYNQNRNYNRNQNRNHNRN